MSLLGGCEYVVNMKAVMEGVVITESAIIFPSPLPKPCIVLY